MKKTIKDIVSQIYNVIKFTHGDNPTISQIDEASKKMIDLMCESAGEVMKKSIIKQVKAKFVVTAPSGTLLKSDKEHQSWYFARKSKIDFYYWERYKKYLEHDGFSSRVINNMDNISDTLVDLLGDPSSDYLYRRKGLVIGEVQSGKTANYISIIAKAADSGYKVVFLLAGMINNLRSQTQERIDLGFLGYDSSKNYLNATKEGNKIGVGEYDLSRVPITMTTLQSDFDKSFADHIGLNIKSLKEPLIFVIKKNGSILKNIYRWIEKFHNKDDLSKLPMLIIDDEADQASINTKKSEDDPTTINREIRKLLKLFPKHNYVGFTATPFANVFIDPDTDDDMIGNDLFPSDFIYSLDSPNNYIGPEKIFSEDSHYNYMLEKIYDMDSILKLKHKKNDILNVIPKSLETAILLFLISNAIRDIRGDKVSHRSMLVNLSRYTNVQNEAALTIEDYVKETQNQIKHYPYRHFKEKTIYKKISEIYSKYYSERIEEDISIENILDNLNDSIQPIKVTAVNIANKAEEVLNYKTNKDNGLRVIAVGGQILSRGLTLEGLTISYFYRNSKYYDTLMQMGRWFGYRDGYSDLCKIFMEEEAIEWYSYIAEATKELQLEIKDMKKSGATPNDFGLRVRKHPTTLYISAPNKLRNSHDFERQISLSAEVIETPRLKNNQEVTKNNFFVLSKLLNEVRDFKNDYFDKRKNILFKGVGKEYIIDFLSNFVADKSCLHFQTNELTNFIEHYQSDLLEKWDVVIIEGSIVMKEKNLSLNLPEYLGLRTLVKRSYKLINDKIIQVSGERNRLGGPRETSFGLTSNEIHEAELNYENHYKSLNEPVPGKTAKTYTRYLDSRSPLMMVYPVYLENSNNDKGYTTKLDGQIVLGIGLAFPKLEGNQQNFIKYKINKRAYNEMFYDDDYDEIEGD